MTVETRTYPRFHLDALADVLGEEVVLARPMADLSLAGCRFKGPAWETVGTEVQLMVTLPRLSTHVPMQGVVTRADAAELTIKFQHMTDDQISDLRKHLRDATQRASPRR